MISLSRLMGYWYSTLFVSNSLGSYANSWYIVYAPHFDLGACHRMLQINGIGIPVRDTAWFLESSCSSLLENVL